MTGRSTGTEDMSIRSLPDKVTMQAEPNVGEAWSTNIVHEMIDKMTKQTTDINELMRHSIASGYSFHSHVRFFYLYRFAHLKKSINNSI